MFHGCGSFVWLSRTFHRCGFDCGSVVWFSGWLHRCGVFDCSFTLGSVVRFTRRRWGIFPVSMSFSLSLDAFSKENRKCAEADIV